jgi:hypothetical protein
MSQSTKLTHLAFLQPPCLSTVTSVMSDSANTATAAGRGVQAKVVDAKKQRRAAARSQDDVEADEKDDSAAEASESESSESEDSEDSEDKPALLLCKEHALASMIEAAATACRPDSEEGLAAAASASAAADGNPAPEDSETRRHPSLASLLHACNKQFKTTSRYELGQALAFKDQGW